MKRRFLLTTLALLGLCLVSRAQIFPSSEVEYPDTDPHAFKIITPAALEDSFRRIERELKALEESKTDADRDYWRRSILGHCQEELGKSFNAAGVVVVERTDKDAKPSNLPIRWQGAYSAVERIIRSLGDRGLELYEQEYGARAQNRLETALATRDRRELVEVNQGYGLTKAGVESAVRLAMLEFEEGNPDDAARGLERALHVPSLLTDARRAYLSSWLARCYQMLGERAHLARLIRDSQSISDQRVQVGDSSTTLGEVLKVEFQNCRDAGQDTLADLQIDWAGGNYSNHAVFQNVGDFSKSAGACTLPRLDASQVHNRFMNYSSPTVPAQIPVFDGSTLFVNIGDKLVAYDVMNAGGQPLWKVKPFPTESHNWRTSEPDPNLILTASTWRGTVFAALENPLTTRIHKNTPDRMHNLYSHYPKVRRALCAVDSSTGKLLWKYGGEYHGSPDETTNFLHSVVYNGVLYAIGTRVVGQAEIFLYALEPETGKKLWSLRLCYGQQETTMFGRPAREPHPSIPAIANGELYLCTNIGGVVSVNLARRSLTWISRYPYVSRPRSKYIRQYYRPVTWATSPTMYAEKDGRAFIIVAPTDSRKLIGMDAFSGEVKWTVARENSPMFGGKFLIGIWDGKAWVGSDGGVRGIASSRLSAYNLSDGRPLLTKRVSHPKTGQTMGLKGRPTMTQGKVLWPGYSSYRDCALCEVDLNSFTTGRYADVRRSWAESGYSVYAQHGLVFAVYGANYTDGSNILDFRFDAEQLLKNAEAAVAANPDNARALTRLGTLQIRQGQDTKGLETLRKAFKVAQTPPADVQSRDFAARTLFATYLRLSGRALQSGDIMLALGFVENARDYAVNKNHLAQCWIQKEAILLKSKSEKDIREFYQDTIDTAPDFAPADDLPADLYASVRLAQRLKSADADRAVGLWQFVIENARNRALRKVPLRTLAVTSQRIWLKQEGMGHYDDQQSRASELFKRGVAGWKKILAIYPFADQATDSAIALAQQLRNDGDPREASKVLDQLLTDAPETPRKHELAALQALCDYDAGEMLRARFAAKRLIRDHPNATIVLDGHKLTFKQALAKLLEVEFDANKIVLPKVPETLKAAWTRTLDPTKGTDYARIPEQSTMLQRGQVHVGMNQDGMAWHSITPTDGSTQWRQPLQTFLTRVYVAGETMIGVAHSQAVGVNMEGRQQFEISPEFNIDASDAAMGMLVLAGRTVVDGRQSTRITAYDASTGSALWTQTLPHGVVHAVRLTPDGVAVMTRTPSYYLTLLGLERGTTIADVTLDFEFAEVPRSLPLYHKDRIWLVSNEGRVAGFNALSLKREADFDTEIISPRNVVAHDDSLIVEGIRTIVAYDLSGKNKWKFELPPTFYIHSTTYSPERAFVIARSTTREFRVFGVDTETGAIKFEQTLERHESSDSMKHCQSVAFANATAFVLQERGRRDGRTRVLFFRVIVIDQDGNVRLDDRKEANSDKRFANMAVGEGFLVAYFDGALHGYVVKD